MCQVLERGLFDALFFADVLGVYDVYGGSVDPALQYAVSLPIMDPVLLIPALADSTTNLGFGVTCTLTYELPHVFARRMSTLDHLTNGRIGWNIVTGFLQSAGKATGDGKIPQHSKRYDIAEEYMEVVYRLWEGSWEDDAACRDRKAGSSQIQKRCTKSGLRASITRSTRYISANPRHRERQFFIKPAPQVEDEHLRVSMPKEFSRPVPPSKLSATWSEVSEMKPSQPDGTARTSRFTRSQRLSWQKPIAKRSTNSTTIDETFNTLQA